MTALLTERFTIGGVLGRARAGDHDAFASLVGAHEAMVFGLAYHFFNDRDRAEEIAQEVFLQLYRSLDDLESDEHVLFWLRQVTTRRCIDAARRARLKAVPLDAVPEPQAKSEAGDPWLQRKLKALVAELPETQRVVVTLRYQEDLDPSEICRIIDMPVNTVKSHLHRAIQALRRALGEC